MGEENENGSLECKRCTSGKSQVHLYLLRVCSNCQVSPLLIRLQRRKDEIVDLWISEVIMSSLFCRAGDELSLSPGYFLIQPLSLSLSGRAAISSRLSVRRPDRHLLDTPAAQKATDVPHYLSLLLQTWRASPHLPD